MSAPLAESKVHRLELQLRAMVSQLRVGDRLPAERDMSARWRVARMTVRRAVDALIADGLLERRHGSGTYVVPQPMVRLLGLTSFSHDMRQRGLVPGNSLLSLSSLSASASQAANLQVPLGTPILQISRLRLASDEPIAVETVWIPQSFVPGLDGSHLDGSLYRILSARYKIVVASAIVAIEPILPDRKTSKLLGIRPGQPCLRLKMVDSDARGRVIMTAECVYRGDKYHLSADVVRTSSANLSMRGAA